MGRYKCQVNVRRHRGVIGKKDTPVKPAPSRRNKFRKLPPIKRHETIPEEPDQNVPAVRSAHPALVSFKTIRSESALHSSSVTSKGNTSSPATPALVSPAGRPSTQMTLSRKGFTPVTTPDDGTLSPRPESVTSSSMESDVTFSSDDDEEDDSSSSLPSPEIFRRESHVETLPFTVMDNGLGHHPYMKNSTLLDVSYAEGIHTYHPPNLSTIIDSSSVLSEKKAENNPLLDPETEVKLKTMSLKPVKPSLNSGTETPPKLNTRRPISYRKKVWFKSPIISETFDAKCTPAENITPPAATQPATTVSPAEQKKPDVDAPRAGESSSKNKAPGPEVFLKRPETAKFFDFETESEKDAVFQMMRERSARLRSGPLFPLAAAKPTIPLAL